jgi:arginyl-tRNA synthetase
VDANTVDGIVKAKQQLIELLTRAANAAQRSGKLPMVTLPEVSIERPQNPEHGDYASSLPLKLARSASMNPFIAKNCWFPGERSLIVMLKQFPRFHQF